MLDSLVSNRVHPHAEVLTNYLQFSASLDRPHVPVCLIPDHFCVIALAGLTTGVHWC